MTEPRYDPDERFSLDEDAETVIKKLFGVEIIDEPSEDEEVDEPES